MLVAAVRDPPEPPLFVLRAMEFAQRLGKQRNLTQQALADLAHIHVSQVRRYGGGGAMPTLDVVKRLTVALSTSADSLLFDDRERDPDDDLRLQFEAITRPSDDEKRTVCRVLEGLLIAHNVKHDASRWAT